MKYLLYINMQGAIYIRKITWKVAGFLTKFAQSP